jgi:hypothetical protein
MLMSDVMSWIFGHGRSDDGPGEVSRGHRWLPGTEPAQKRGLRSRSVKARTTGEVPDLGEPLFVDFPTLVRSQGGFLKGLIPVPEQAALVSLVGTGITDPSRYADAAEAIDQLRAMAPPEEGVLMQLFRQQLREESAGHDFLFVHFAGDPLSFGFLICALSTGGFMAGWKLG